MGKFSISSVSHVSSVSSVCSVSSLSSLSCCANKCQKAKNLSLGKQYRPSGFITLRKYVNENVDKEADLRGQGKVKVLVTCQGEPGQGWNVLPSLNWPAKHPADVSFDVCLSFCL